MHSKNMRLMTLLFLLFFSFHSRLGVKAVKLNKHILSGATYLNHLERRGIVPDVRAREAILRRGHSAERAEGGLIFQYHPEYDSGNQHTIPIELGARISRTETDSDPHGRRKKKNRRQENNTFSSISVGSNSSVHLSSPTIGPTSIISSSSNENYLSASTTHYVAAVDTSSGAFNNITRSTDNAGGPLVNVLSTAVLAPGQSNLTQSSSRNATASANITYSSSSNAGSPGPSDPGGHPVVANSTVPNTNSSAGPEGHISSVGASPTVSRHTGPKPSASDLVVEMENMFGIAYTIDALIGKEKVPVPVLVDTGSATFWVASKQCTLCRNSKMTTSVDMLDTCSPGKNDTTLTYGTGKVFGCATNTSVGIGGLKLADFPVVGVTNIDDVTAGLGDVFSGMWGIASAALNKLGDTLVDIWYKSGMITSPEVGFYFVRDEDSASLGASEVIIGDALNIDALPFPIDKTRSARLDRYRGDSGHYSVKLDGMEAAGKPVVEFNHAKVIVDTGTTRFVVPERLQLPIFGTLGNGTTIRHPTTHRYVLPCNLMAPTDAAMTLTLGGVKFAVQYRDLIGDPLLDYPEFCYGALMSLDDELILLGGTFLVNVYHSVNTHTGAVTMYGLKGSRSL